MSQIIFKNPVVSSGAVLTGTGNGTLTVDKLTHFTVTQTYTLTCISKSPDTIFSVAGSLDGLVGIATVGTQFFDQDLKIFLTIQQGSKAFKIGDQFVLGVSNGTDLNQQNIDSYDELPQKNFGAGLFGTARGDHNLRYSDTAQKAFLYRQDLFFQAVASGSSGDSITVEYLDALPGTAASLVVQDLTFTSTSADASGNTTTFRYENYDPAITAYVNIQDIRFQALTAGSSGNSISIQFTSGATAGSEVVTVVGNAITIQIESGVSTANQIVSAVLASSPAMALLGSVAIRSGGVGTNPQTTTSITFLANGADAVGAAGSEVVTVVGTAVKVKMQSGVSTATQIKAALDASVPAAALITTTITGVGSNAQTATPLSATPLTGGVDGTGLTSPFVNVSGNAIQVYFKSGVATATQIKSALDGSVAAAALITTTILGVSSYPQYAPYSAQNLSGGRNKVYSFNHNEFTDSSNFSEGNASIAIKDVIATGQAKFSNHVQVSGPLSLISSEGGNAIADTQRTINDLIQKDQITVSTSGNSLVRYLSGQIIFSTAIQITFRNSGILNTIPATNSPISISDGQSLYALLSPRVSSNITTSVGTTTSSNPNAFRLATRVGNYIYWYNGVTTTDNEVIRLGSNTSYQNQIMSVISGGGNFLHSDTTPGQITFDGTLQIRPLGTSAVLSISPTTVTLADGEAAYIALADPIITGSASILIESLTNIDLARTDRLLLFFRSGNIVYYRNGSSILQGESTRFDNSKGGGAGGTIHATFFDPVSTTLPTGASATFDDVSLQENDRVLFTNLSVGNKRIYKATGVGSSITWTAQSDFTNGLDPIAGDQVIINKGTKFGQQIPIYDGTNFQINQVVRYFNGTDFWEQSSIKTGIISNNLTNTLFSVNLTGSENIFVDFSILRGGNKQVGTFVVTTDGTDISYGSFGPTLGSDIGVDLFADLNSGSIRFRYTSDNSGASGTIKYTVKRFADGLGGPTGITSYSGAPVPTGGAAGSTTQIQYNTAGNLDADSGLTWSSGSKTLQVGGLNIIGLQGPTVLGDNTSTPTTIITIDSNTYPSGIIKYSCVRDGIRRTGRIMFAASAAGVSFEDDFTSLSDIGVTFSATLSGTDILIQFTSTSTGFAGSFKYSAEYWS